MRFAVLRQSAVCPRRGAPAGANRPPKCPFRGAGLARKRISGRSELRRAVDGSTATDNGQVSAEVETVICRTRAEVDEGPIAAALEVDKCRDPAGNQKQGPA